MMGGPMRLRRRRAVYAGRRPQRWRLPLSGGIFALVIGAACLAPLAPTALAPLGATDTQAPQPPAAAQAVGVGGGAQAGVGAALAAVPGAATAPLAPTPRPLSGSAALVRAAYGQLPITRPSSWSIFRRRRSWKSSDPTTFRALGCECDCLATAGRYRRPKVGWTATFLRAPGHRQSLNC